ncbi:MAG: bifunctional diguanylate cyclase/phosphohydrolase [Anaerolineales bacterium]
MGKLSLTARLYILGTIIAGGALGVWQLSRLPGVDFVLALAIGVLAALAQIFKVEGPTERSSYNISWVTYGFAFMLLGAPGAVFVILLAHIGEWVKHRYPWFIQSFNIAQFAIAASTAVLMCDWVKGTLWVSPSTEALAIVSAIAIVIAMTTFTLLNHWLVGVVLKLARGQSFKESGVFERLPLAIDFTLFGMGVASAFIWQINPFAAILAAVPLYLIYTTLRVPALQRQTQIDPKTGLFNSKYFAQALENELARADRHDRPLTVVMADLDLLRNINNTYGHLAGDACLIAVANIVKGLVRDYDVVARFGGEEFAILMPETTYEQAYPRVEEIRAAIEAARIDVSTSVAPIRVTMSFGISGREKFGQTPNAIIHCADLAVYQAKLSGRNRICRYTAGETENVIAIPPQSEETLAPQAPNPPATVVIAPLPVVSPPPVASPSPVVAPPLTLPTPKLQPRPWWAINAYIAVVAALAIGLSVWLLSGVTLPDWLGLTMFAVLVILAEGLAIEIYVRDTAVSTAAAPMIAGAILFGPVGALTLGVAVATVSWIKHRSPVSRFIFNAANHILSGLLAVGLLRLLQPLSVIIEAHVVQIVVAVLAGGLMYLSSTGLLALAIDLSTGQPFVRVWMERFRWLWPYYLALGAFAFVLMTAFAEGGLIAVLVTVVPLLMMRYSQTQYIDHTKAMVAELRTTNTELYQRAEQISTLNEELLIALSHAIDLRDPDVHGHSQQVARYAKLMAQELGLSPERTEVVRKAGLLHDIGKLGIPENILFKPTRLSEVEYITVQQHANLGAEIVSNVQSLKALVPFIRHHHERYDGYGYPAQLSAHDIPLEARILSVADTVEAMASDRPYRYGQEAEAILEEIKTHAGRQFDPQVVEAFVQIVQREGEGVIVNSARKSQTDQSMMDAERLVATDVSPLRALARNRNYSGWRPTPAAEEISPLFKLARERYLFGHPSTLEVGEVSPLRALAMKRTWVEAPVHSSAD